MDLLQKSFTVNNPVGRPSLGPDQKRNNKVVVCLRGNEKSALKAMAKESGTSVSNVIRELIIERNTQEQITLYFSREQKEALAQLALERKTSINHLVQGWLLSQSKHSV